MVCGTPNNKTEGRMSTAEDSAKVWTDEISNGWLILLTSLIGIAAGASSLLFYSIGVFFEPFQREFGWNRGQISGALIYLTLGFVISGPVTGWLIDRYGARIVALVSIPLLALSMIGLANLENSLPAFYALFFIAGSFGGGTTPIVYTRVVNGNFSTSRGLALGIVLAGTGISALVLPSALAAIIGSHGWRSGCAMLATIAVVAWPLVFFGFRDVEGAAPSQAKTVEGVDRIQAIRSRIFWTISFGFIAVATAVSGMVVHMVPLLRDAGLALSQAAAIASLIGVGVILGRVLIGWAIDRIFAPYIACFVFLATACGCALLNLGGAQAAPVAAFLIGFALGAEIDLIAYLAARYFGLRNYGFIYGSIYSMFSIGAAAGPAIIGHMFDVNGNYRLALWAMAACLVVGAAAMMTLPQFAKKG
jgi:MFS family permease